MPIVEVHLSVSAAMVPDGTASNAAPALQRVKSSTANNPKPVFMEASFDATTVEYLMWRFKVPSTWDGTTAPVLKFPFKMATATSGNILGQATFQATTPGDAADVDADAFDSFNTSSATSVGSTAGYEKEASITLTNRDSLAPNDNAVLVFGRDTGAGDTATGDMQVAGEIVVEFTTA